MSNFQNTIKKCDNCQTATNDNKLYVAHPSQKNIFDHLDQYWISNKTKDFTTKSILIPTQKDSTFEDDYYSWQRRYGLKLKAKLPICPFVRSESF